MIKLCGHDGIGRHARFRFSCASVRVQIPVPAPKRRTSAESRCPSFWVPPPRGQLHPSVIEMLGRNEFALRRGFACGKTLVRRKRAAGQKAGWAAFLLTMLKREISILTVHSPKRRTSAESRCPSFGVPPPRGRLHPSVIEMLGRNEFALRRGFACGKTLVRRKRAAGQKAGLPVLLRLFSILENIDFDQLLQKKGHDAGRVLFSGFRSFPHPPSLPA